MASAGLSLTLVYISEAHSDLWPIGGLEDGPHRPIQKSFEDRVGRLEEFLTGLTPKQREGAKHIRWMVDVWTPPKEDGTWDYTYPSFENLFHAWPDCFVLVDKEKRLLEDSTYGTNMWFPSSSSGQKVQGDDAILLNDYAKLIEDLLARSH